MKWSQQDSISTFAEENHVRWMLRCEFMLAILLKLFGSCIIDFKGVNSA